MLYKLNLIEEFVHDLSPDNQRTLIRIIAWEVDDTNKVQNVSIMFTQGESQPRKLIYYHIYTISIFHIR